MKINTITHLKKEINLQNSPDISKTLVITLIHFSKLLNKASRVKVRKDR
jgi:hypothetical protein